MTGRARLRYALTGSVIALTALGVGAIPSATAADTATATVGTETTAAQQCLQIDRTDGSAEIVKISASLPVPTTVSALIADKPNPAVVAATVSEILASPSCTVTSTSSSSSSSSTTSTTTSTSTTTTTTTTTTGTTTTGTTTTKTGPGKPHKQHSSSSPSSGGAHHGHTRHRTSSSSHKRRHHSAKPTNPKKTRAHTRAKGAKGKTGHQKTAHRSHSGGGTSGTPGYSLSLPTAPAAGVPNFFINSFQIPPFLLPIYQAAGIQYQVPWQILAAINEIETDYGRNLSVSSAGAVGWMQFMPSTWKQWGIDANGDGVADPYNPVDAIFSAARYLHAAGASTNLSKAIFAYNHADWYVQSVLLRAKLIGGMPQKLVSALTDLVEGHFPVAAAAKYSDDSVVSRAGHPVTGSNAAITVNSDPSAKGTAIFAKQGSPVVAVNDGKIIKLGYSSTLGHYIELQDATGNVYTYSQLGSVSAKYPVPKQSAVGSTQVSDALGAGTTDLNSSHSAASAGTQPKVLTALEGPQARLALTAESRHALTSELGGGASSKAVAAPKSAASAGAQAGAAGGSQTSSETSTETSTVSAPLVKERLFAHPNRPASFAAGGMQQVKNAGTALTSFRNYFADTLHLGRNQYTLQPLQVGSIVIAGTILGRVGAADQGVGSHLYFQIQPAGRGAPDIDPKPILDGWKLLQATDVYRANGVNPFYGGVGGAKSSPTVGQVLLMSKQQLERRVLTDRNVKIYACGRRDIEAGKIDRRILAVVEYLSTSGLHPYVSGLACDASVNGTTGVDEAGTTGESVDISQINGVPIAGHTGPNSVTVAAIRRLLALQGSLAPAQIVGPISFRDQSTTLALPSHQNRIQVLFGSTYGSNGKTTSSTQSALKPSQWTTLINRLSQIPEPIVPVRPSRYAIHEHTH